MRASIAFYDLVKDFETGKDADTGRLLPRGEPALKAYRDDVGVWTIGWGSTRGVKENDVITYQQAERLLRSDTRQTEVEVARLLRGHATTQSQFDALCSLVFNIGAAAFAKSTCLRLHRKGEFTGAAEAMKLFKKGRVGGKLVTLKGLVRRRAAEAALYLSDVTAEEAEPTPRFTPEPEKHVVKTRTILNAGGVAAGGGLVTAEALLDVKGELSDVRTDVSDFHYVNLVLGVVIAACALFAIYLRLSQRRRGEI